MSHIVFRFPRSFPPNTFIVSGVLLLVSAFSLSGCATYSREDCEIGDWEMLGYEAAMQGKGASRYEEVTKDCRRHGIAPDLDLFTVGFDKGRRTYCSPATGFRTGRHNAPPEFACPDEQAQDFSVAFGMGRKIWSVEAPLNALRRELSSNERTIYSLNDKLDALDCSQGDNFERQTCRSERADLREDLNRAQDSARRNREEIRQKERAFERTLSSTLKDFERRFPDQ